MLVGKTGDRQPVGDTANAADLFGGPMSTGRLQDDGLFRVGDEKTVVISKPAVLVPAAAPLPVSFQQTHNRPHGRVGIASSFQCQPQQIHSRQADFGIRLPGKNRLVADHHAVLVGPHLGSPHPEGPTQKNRMGDRHLRDFNPGAAKCGPRSVLLTGNPIQNLSFVRVAVRVLREQHRLGANDDESVAHACRITGTNPEMRSAPRQILVRRSSARDHNGPCHR